MNTGLPNGRAPEQGTARQNIPKPAPGRAIGIIGIPDTVNEARLRSIIPEQFAVVKVEMKPDNEGAIVEFKEAAVYPHLERSNLNRMLVQPPWPSRECNFQVILYA